MALRDTIEISPENPLTSGPSAPPALMTDDAFRSRLDELIDVQAAYKAAEQRRVGVHAAVTAEACRRHNDPANGGTKWTGDGGSVTVNVPSRVVVVEDDAAFDEWVRSGRPDLLLPARLQLIDPDEEGLRRLHAALVAAGLDPGDWLVEYRAVAADAPSRVRDDGAVMRDGSVVTDDAERVPGVRVVRPDASKVAVNLEPETRKRAEKLLAFQVPPSMVTS